MPAHFAVYCLLSQVDSNQWRRKNNSGLPPSSTNFRPPGSGQEDSRDFYFICGPLRLIRLHHLWFELIRPFEQMNINSPIGLWHFVYADDAKSISGSTSDVITAFSSYSLHSRQGNGADGYKLSVQNQTLHVRSYHRHLFHCLSVCSMWDDRLQQVNVQHRVCCHCCRSNFYRLHRCSFTNL